MISLNPLRHAVCQDFTSPNNGCCHVKSDSQLQNDVVEELKRDPSVDASAIEVEVKNGVVALSGHVANYLHKWYAERAVQRVDGTKQIIEEIDVALPESSRCEDADLTAAVSQALDWSAAIPKNRIKISVLNGWVTMSGEVDRDYQRCTAIAAIRHLAGVAGINDDIAVRPHNQASDVETKIEAALQSHAHEESEATGVSVEDGSVALSGTLDSWADRDVAKLAACTNLTPRISRNPT